MTASGSVAEHLLVDVFLVVRINGLVGHGASIEVIVVVERSLRQWRSLDRLVQVGHNARRCLVRR